MPEKSPEQLKIIAEEIVGIGKTMAEAVKEKPAVVDCVLWYFGQEL